MRMSHGSSRNFVVTIAAAGFLIGFGTGSAAAQAGVSGDLPGITITPVPAPKPVAEEAAPRRFRLGGVIVDQYGEPLAGATVRVLAGGGEARTDAAGRFTLATELSPASRITVFHRNAEPRTFWAASVYPGSGGTALLQLVRYDIRFRVGPEGGRFDGPVSFEVPAGALEKPTAIGAALLPAHMAQGGAGMQALPLAGLVLAPAGLKFNKPIKVRVPLASTIDAGAVAPAVQVFDPAAGRYRTDKGAAIRLEGSSAVLSLTHFTRYTAADVSRGVTSEVVRTNTRDANGDGRVSVEDADLVIVSCGGPHDMSWSLTTSRAHTEMRAETRSRSEERARTTSVSAGASFGGVGVRIEREDTRQSGTSESHTRRQREANRITITEKDGFGTDEGESRTYYLLRKYVFTRVREWQRFEPNAREKANLRAAYERQHRAGNVGVFNISGSRGLVVGRALYGGMTVAVTRENGEYRYYRQSGAYIRRTPMGTRPHVTRRCGPQVAPGGGRGPAVNARSFSTGGMTYDQAQLFPDDSGGLVSVRGTGVRTDPNPDPARGAVDPYHFDERECLLGEGRRTITQTRSAAEESEFTLGKSRAQGTRTGVSASASGGYGGAGLSAGAGVSESVRIAQSAARSHAESFTTEMRSTIEVVVRNAHPYGKPGAHKTDHRLYNLYRFTETRHWQPIEPGSVPSMLRAFPRDAERDFFRVDEPQGPDRVLMRAGEGTWYQAGLPVIRREPIGVLFAHVATRACEDTPAASAPPAAFPPPETTLPPVVSAPPAPSSPPPEITSAPPVASAPPAASSPPPETTSGPTVGIVPTFRIGGGAGDEEEGGGGVGLSLSLPLFGGREQPVLTRSPGIARCARDVGGLSGADWNRGDTFLGISRSRYVDAVRGDMHRYLVAADPSTTYPHACALKLKDFLQRATPGDRQWAAELYAASYRAARSAR